MHTLVLHEHLLNVFALLCRLAAVVARTAAEAMRLQAGSDIVCLLLLVDVNNQAGQVLEPFAAQQLEEG